MLSELGGLATRGKSRSSVEERKDCLSIDSTLMNEARRLNPGVLEETSAIVAARVNGRIPRGEKLARPDAAAAAGDMLRECGVSSAIAA